MLHKRILNNNNNQAYFLNVQFSFLLKVNKVYEYIKSTGSMSSFERVCLGKFLHVKACISITNVCRIALHNSTKSCVLVPFRVRHNVSGMYFQPEYSSCCFFQQCKLDNFKLISRENYYIGADDNKKNQAMEMKFLRLILNKTKNQIFKRKI